MAIESNNLSGSIGSDSVDTGSTPKTTKRDNTIDPQDMDWSSDNIVPLTHHNDFPYAYFEKNFYSMYLMGSSADADHRHMGWGLVENGYATFFETQIEPQIAKGVKRFHLHLPHGTHGGPMEYDQLLEAVEEGARYAYQEFYETLANYALQYPDVVFLLYFGTIRMDPYFVSALAENRIGDWLNRAVESILPALRAPNVDIGFDTPMGNPGQFGEQHPNHLFCRLIKNLKEHQGREVYIEPRPYAPARWWHDFNILSTESFWKRSDPERHPDSAWAARNDMLTGKIIRMQTGGNPKDSDGNTPDWRIWLPERICHAMFDGNTSHQYSHGLVRILHSTSSSHGPLAENLQEIYENTLAKAVELGYLN